MDSSARITNRILVRVPQWLGDAVVSTIFLTRLKAKYPEALLSVLSPVTLSPLFTTHPAVDSVILLPYASGGSVLDVARSIKNGNFSTIYILPRSFRSALEAWLGRIPRRIGFRGDLRSLFLSERVRYDSKLLYAHRYLKLIGEAGIDLKSIRPHFPSEDAGLGPLPKPILGLAPASIAPARTWAPERFAEAAVQFLNERGGSVLLLGSAREKSATAAILQSILQECPQSVVKDLAGHLSLPQLGGVMKSLDGFLGNDSGLMHVASVFQIPSVIIFGASEPSAALPPYGRAVPLQKKVFSCVPCLKNTCVRFGKERNGCLSAVTSLDVQQALKTIFS